MEYMVWIDAEYAGTFSETELEDAKKHARSLAEQRGEVAEVFAYKDEQDNDGERVFSSEDVA